MIKRKSSIGPRCARAIALASLAWALAGCGGAGLGSGLGVRTNDPGQTTGNPSTGTGGFVNGVLPPDTILYTEETVDSTQLRAVKPDGSNDRLLATTSQSVQAFAYSPVTSDVVFAGSTASNGFFGIYRGTQFSLEGAAKVVDPQYGAVFDIAISQDGRTAIFSATTDFLTTNIYAVNLDGGPVHQIGEGQGPAISPDGQRVAYSADVSGSTEIAVSSIWAGSPSFVTGAGFSDSYPSWSRDGSHIVFCSNRANSTFDLFTVKTDGTGLTGVTSSTAYNEYAPSYSDDGSKISYILQDDAQVKGGLYTIRADAGTSGAQPVLVKSMQDGGVFTYWTSLTGRSLGRGESVPYHFRKR